MTSIRLKTLESQIDYGVIIAYGVIVVSESLSFPSEFNESGTIFTKYSFDCILSFNLITLLPKIATNDSKETFIR